MLSIIYNLMTGKCHYAILKCHNFFKIIKIKLIPITYLQKTKNKFVFVLKIEEVSKHAHFINM